MYLDVIMSGFGGQGIMMIGNLLSIAAIEEGRYVTYFPTYGVEMRGGAANCTVIISDEEIGSPVVGNPMSLIAMNGPSLEKFAGSVKGGGTVILNSSLCDAGLIKRGDLRIVDVPANERAEEVGSQQLASMVALGAFVSATGAVGMETLVRMLPGVISQRYENLIPLNENAIRAGGEIVRV